MLNRSIAPNFHTPKFTPFLTPHISEPVPGLKLYSFNSGYQEVFKIEAILPFGSSSIENPIIATLCLEMLREGSKSMSAAEINNKLDYYGAFLNFKSGIDNSFITLYGKSTFLDKLIPLFAEIIFLPAFNEDALNKHKLRVLQELSINQKKTNYWSPRLLRKCVFGPGHAYSKLVTDKEIARVQLEDIMQFHQRFIAPGLQTLVIAGLYNEDKLQSLFSQYFPLYNSEIQYDIKETPISTSTCQEALQLDHSSQASIALGKLSIRNSHNAYPIHSLLTKILGGYFGSRLMKKIREEEGLTYGIHAYNVHLKAGSYMQILADVKFDSVDKSIELILEQLDNLQHEAISLEELNTVKNYMLGEFVNDSNTVFDFAELYKVLLLRNLPDDYYQSYYKKINMISSNDVLDMARQSYVEDQFSIIRVL